MNGAITYDQDAFLSNSRNKQELINHVTANLQSQGISVVYPVDDADMDVAAAALNIACAKQTDIAVYADDTDILALLIYYWQNSMADILFI